MSVYGTTALALFSFAIGCAAAVIAMGGCAAAKPACAIVDVAHHACVLLRYVDADGVVRERRVAVGKDGSLGGPCP